MSALHDPSEWLNGTLSNMDALSLGPVHMGSQARHMTHVSKSQHGAKVATLEPREIIDYNMVDYH
jgi:hypothetical protein